MKKIKNISIIFLLLSSILFAGELKWERDFNKAVELAKAQNKYILVDFYTDWCKWCHVMDDKTYSDDSIIKLINDHFIAVKINPEKEGSVTLNGQVYSNAQFSQASGVSGYPATVIFTSNAEYVTTVAGYLDIPRFKSMVDYISAEGYKKMAFDDYSLYNSIKEKYNADKTNIDLNFVLGVFERMVLKNNDKAEGHLLAVVNKDKDYTEASAELSKLYKERGNTLQADKYQKLASVNGFPSEEQIIKKIQNILQNL